MYQRKTGVNAAAPPAVDDLVGISHGKQSGIPPPQSIQKSQLLLVTVLHLVDDNPGRGNGILSKKRFPMYQQFPKSHGVAQLLLLLQRLGQLPYVIQKLVKALSLHGASALAAQPGGGLQALGEPCGILNLIPLPPDKFLGDLQFLLRQQHCEIPGIAQFLHRQRLL